MEETTQFEQLELAIDVPRVIIPAPSVIRAVVETDDYQRRAVFNACGFFALESDDDLLELAEDFGPCYPTDYVAYWADGVDESVSSLFRYIWNTSDGRPRTGFQVNVDPLDAAAWVAHHRPQIADEFTALAHDYAATYGRCDWKRLKSNC